MIIIHSKIILFSLEKHFPLMRAGTRLTYRQGTNPEERKPTDLTEMRHANRCLKSEPKLL